MQQLYWILAVVSDIIDIHHVLGVCYTYHHLHRAGCCYTDRFLFCLFSPLMIIISITWNHINASTNLRSEIIEVFISAKVNERGANS